MSIEKKYRSGLIIYSSKTGNTKKLATDTAKCLGDGICAVSVDDKPELADLSWIIVAYWVDKGTADKKTLEFLESLSGMKVGVIGTLGAYPNSQHAKDVENSVTKLVSEKNIFLGSFLCQGKVDPTLIEQFKNLPADHPHAMNEERRKRHQEAAKHPDENDVAHCVAACRTMIVKADPS